MESGLRPPTQTVVEEEPHEWLEIRKPYLLEMCTDIMWTYENNQAQLYSPLANSTKAAHVHPVNGTIRN